MGFRRCKLHGGSNPSGRKAAEKDRATWLERLVSLIDPALSEVERLVSDPDPKVRLAAARDLLDRAGVKVTEEHGTELRVVITWPD